MGLKKSILKIFSVNMLSMVTGIIVSFIVPAILSIEGYSELKTFNFYLSYTAFFSLGYVDGMYIKYGGKSIETIKKEELKLENIVFILIQMIFSVIILSLAILQKNIILGLISISIIPSAIFGFFTMLYQATGEFGKYSKIMMFSTMTTLILNLVLVFMVESQNYLMYCLIPIITNGCLFVYLQIKFLKKYKNIKIRYDKNVWVNIKVGFFILLGNLSVILFYGIDRWFVKFFFNVNEFAYYSFAVSMLGLVNVLVSAVAVTMYNYISKDENEEKIKKIKNILLIIGVIASAIYFMFAAIINLILPKYIPALSVIAISFASYPYMITINAIFVNLYKSRKEEIKYFKIVVSMVAVAIIYNLIAILISNNIQGIAVATTLAFISWYIYSMRHFKYLISNFKEILFLSVNTISFLYVTNSYNWFIGGIVYITIAIIMIMICYKNIVMEYLKKIVIKSQCFWKKLIG